MSVPAWKQAILNRRKQKEDEGKQKQAEEDSFFASLPPWKRALVLKQREKEGKTGATVERSESLTKKQPVPTTEPTTPVVRREAGAASSAHQTSTTRRSSASPAFRQAPLSQQTARKTSVPPQLGGSGSIVARQPAASTQAQQQPWTTQQSRGLTSSAAHVTHAHSTPREHREQDSRPTKTSSPSSSSAAPPKRIDFASPRESSFTPHKTQERERKTIENRRTSIEEKEEDTKKMPLWKQELLRRKKQKQQSVDVPDAPLSIVGTAFSSATEQRTTDRSLGRNRKPFTKPPPLEITNEPQELPERSLSYKPSISPVNKSPTVSSISPSHAATPPSTPSTPSNVQPARSRKVTPPSASVPEVVNRQMEEKKVDKMVKLEGKAHHPPVFQEVQQWANVPQDDPNFKKLPPWRQALILRRRADIANRSQGSQSQEPSSTKQTAPTTTAIPSWKEEMIKKKRNYPPTDEATEVQVVSEKKKTAPKTKVTESVPEKRKAPAPPAPVRYKSTLLPPTPPRPSTNDSTVSGNKVKALLGRFSGGGGQQQTSSSFTTPPAPTPTRKAATETQQQTVVFHVGSDDEDETDGVPFTSIDEVSSDDDDSDSGICSRTYDVNPPEAETAPSTYPLSPTSPLNLNSQKPKKGLRRVSFSDTQLTVEHSYPKYSYHDYDEVQEEAAEEGTHKGPRKHKEEGLSQRLHPSLQVKDSDPYSFSSPSKTNFSGMSSPSRRDSTDSQDIYGYKPSILASYGDALESHLRGDFHDMESSSPEHSVASDTEATDSGPAVGGVASQSSSDGGSDFYASLNTDIAAMIW